MQLIRLPVIKPEEFSFAIRKDEVSYFSIPWHYHPELELNYIIKGRGTRFVGDSIEPYSDGDLVLVGRNLPHYWRSDKSYYEQTGILTEAIVLQFTEDFAGGDLLQRPEAKRLLAIYHRARQGIRLSGELQWQIVPKLHQLLTLRGFDRLLALLNLLNLFGSEASADERLLSSTGFTEQSSGVGDERIDRVYRHVMANFQEEISLEDVATLSHMSPTAFCRYFKARTRKTFTHFLNEVRIGYACKLLMEHPLSITEIGYRSGFNNLSNFHIQFKAFTHMTPNQYIRQHR